MNRMLNFGTGCLPEVIRERKKREAGTPEAASPDGKNDGEVS